MGKYHMLGSPNFALPIRSEGERKEEKKLVSRWSY